jgi:multimeric flavodoxin WrbA
MRRRTMKILNLYYSMTGNTEKVAAAIDEALRGSGHDLDSVRVTGKEAEIDLLQYDWVFVGSGVYAQLPGKPLMELYRERMQAYNKSGHVRPGSPRRASARAVVYCTYGGVHTGINEAIPAVKYLGQLWDHLGYTVVGEWYFVGEYKGELSKYSTGGRLGDIRGRPSAEDLREAAERVRGILQI